MNPAMTNRFNSTPHVPSIPRLESGDRLSRTEFERRYEAMSSPTPPIPHSPTLPLLIGILGGAVFQIKQKRPENE